MLARVLRTLATSGWLGPAAFSRIRSDRRHAGLALSCFPSARYRTARSWSRTASLIGSRVIGFFFAGAIWYLPPHRDDPHGRDYATKTQRKGAGPDKKSARAIWPAQRAKGS